MTRARWAVYRDVILFVLGIIVVFYVLVADDKNESTLLFAALSMMGLGAILRGSANGNGNGK